MEEIKFTKNFLVDHIIKGHSVYIGGRRVARSGLSCVCDMFYIQLQEHCDYDKYCLSPKPSFYDLPYKSLVSAFARLVEDYCYLMNIYCDNSILEYDGKPFYSFLSVKASKINKVVNVYSVYDKSHNLVGFRYPNGYLNIIDVLKDILQISYPSDKYNLIIDLF